MSIDRARRSGSPALLARGIVAAIARRQPRSRADVPSARRPGQRVADAGTRRRDAVGVLRRPGAPAGRARALRRHRVRREPPAQTEIGIRMALGAAPGERRAAGAVARDVLVAHRSHRGAASASWASRSCRRCYTGSSRAIRHARRARCLAASACWRAGCRPRASRIDPAEVLRDS